MKILVAILITLFACSCGGDTIYKTEEGEILICVADKDMRSVCFSPSECVIDDYGTITCENEDHPAQERPDFFEMYYSECITLCEKKQEYAELCRKDVEDLTTCIWEKWEKLVFPETCTTIAGTFQTWINNNDCTH